MTRSFQSHRGIVLVAVAAGLTLGVSACTPPMPPDVLAAQAEQNFTCYSGQQQVTASADLATAIEALNTGLMGQCPDQGIVAAADGSAADVALTSSAPTDAEQKAFTAAACPTGKVVIAPAFAYGVGLAVSGAGMDSVVLPPDVIAGILAGRITTWADPAIAAANEGSDFSSLGDITLLSLDHPDAAVSAMTAYLAKEAPKAWTGGVTDSIAAGTKVATLDDLVSQMSTTDGSVAVLPLPVAVNNSLAVPGLEVQGQTMDPTNSQELQIGAGATTLTIAENGNIFAAPAIGGVPNADTFDAAAAKIVLPSGQPMIGWPVLGFAHLMACDMAATPPLAMSTFLYTVTLNGQGAISGVSFTPLPEPVRTKARTLAVQHNPSPSAVAGTASAPATSDMPPAPSMPAASPSAG